MSINVFNIMLNVAKFSSFMQKILTLDGPIRRFVMLYIAKMTYIRLHVSLLN